MKKMKISIFLNFGLIMLLIPSIVLMSSDKMLEIPKMTISTGSVGGGWYATCSSIADWVNERVKGYPITAIPGSGGMGNPIRVARGDADIGVTFGPFLIMAREGKTPYWEKYPNLRSICSLSSNVHHFLVAKHIDATNLYEVVERKIGLRMASGFPGEANYIILELIFSKLGMTEKDFEKWGGSLVRIGTTGRVDLWKDRHINAFHSISELNAPEVTEAMATREGRLLGLTEPVRNMLVEEFGFIKIEIPPGTYPKQDYAVPSVKLAMVLFANINANKDAIYIITKTIAESEERFRKSYGVFKDWKSKNMIQYLGVEIHEGALKYYRERGWM
jgi:hypothetical protein